MSVTRRPPTVEILPPALAAFQKAVPRVRVLLHDLSSDELITGLQNDTLELAIVVPPAGDQAAGIQFEVLRTQAKKTITARSLRPSNDSA